MTATECHLSYGITHGVTFHPTQVNAPHLNPSHASRYSIYLPQRDGRLSWPMAYQRTGSILSDTRVTPGHVM